MGEIAEILVKPEPTLDPLVSTSSSSDILPSIIEDKLDALDELEGIVESIDNAKNLFIIGGFDPLLDCIRSSQYSELRSRACDVFSVVVQNNPKAQAWALQHSGCLTVICNALQGTSSSPSTSTPSDSTHSHTHPHPHTIGTNENELLQNLKLQASALTALSSLVRDNKEGQQRLVKRGDLSSIMGPIHDWLYYTESTETLHHQNINHSQLYTTQVQKAGKRLIRKALFFLRYLVTGAEADMVMSWILNYPNKPGLLPYLFSILHCISGTDIHNTHIVDDGDSQDARENVLYILQSLLSPTVSFEGVDASTDSDHRKPRSFASANIHSPNLSASTSSVSSNTETPLLLLGPPDSSSLSSSTASSTTTNITDTSSSSRTLRSSLPITSTLQRNSSYPTTSTPAHVTVMDFPTRRNLVKFYTDTHNDAEHRTVAKILQQHHEWLSSRITLNSDELYENEKYILEQVQTFVNE